MSDSDSEAGSALSGANSVSERSSNRSYLKDPEIPKPVALTMEQLLAEQIDILRRMDQRQAAADVSHLPMPTVPATSNSAWNPMLKTVLADNIQPKVEKWRSGLDALLVFLGLFSAVVTTFFVGSFSSLKEDQVARTNELLGNLTDIIIILSGVNSANLSVISESSFAPDSSDVRLNSVWALSLIISLSIAALAVAFRGFLNMVTSSRQGKSSDKLTDIINRWQGAENFLGPSIEALPQLLVIPVVLFVFGLLDALLSSALQLQHRPVPILVVSGLSIFIVVVVVCILLLTLLDGTFNPDTSPFQSTLAHILHNYFIQKSLDIFSNSDETYGMNWERQLSMSSMPTLGSTSVKPSRDSLDGLYSISSHASAPSLDHAIISVQQLGSVFGQEIRGAAGSKPSPRIHNPQSIYHQVLQATYNDDILNEASAALFSMIHWRQCKDPQRSLSNEECVSLLHLLSPETSVRSNLTAAQAIVRLGAFTTDLNGNLMGAAPTSLMHGLCHAARRIHATPSSSPMWDSIFLRALAALVQTHLSYTSKDLDFHPFLYVLSSNFADSFQFYLFSRHGQHRDILHFVFEVLMDKLTTEARRIRSGPNKQLDDLEWDSVFDTLLGTSKLPINTRSVLGALFLATALSSEATKAAIRWLIRVRGLGPVILATHELVKTILKTDDGRAMSFSDIATGTLIISVIVDVYFKSKKFRFRQQLCTATIPWLCKISSLERASSNTRLLRLALDLVQISDLSDPESMIYRNLVQIHEWVRAADAQKPSSFQYRRYDDSIPDILKRLQVLLGHDEGAAPQDENTRTNSGVVSPASDSGVIHVGPEVTPIPPPFEQIAVSLG